MSENNYDFTDLVLLIGTNPLPNYVVAKYFRIKNKDLKRIWLVYSEKNSFYEGTKQYADNLKETLAKDFKNTEIRFMMKNLSDISKAEEIEKQLAEILFALSDIKKIHLNYTGGTKAMSVHAYRALSGNEKVKFSASYLDARDYNIKFDNNPDKSTGDLRTKIHLSMEELFRLHNNKRILSQKGYLDELHEIDRREILHSLTNLANLNKLLELRNWFNTANQGGLFSAGPKDPKKIDDTLKNFNKSHELYSFLSKFPGNDEFCNSKGDWQYSNFNKDRNNKKLKKFLEGGWLEEYVAFILRQKINGNENVKTNIELGTRGANVGSNRLEIDVLVKNGYQICGISCGTSLKNNEEHLPNAIKNKGFEVILRSSQIGGDEARAVLVTLLNKKVTSNLENDLKAATGAGAGKFIVLGREDLPAEILWEKLNKHIYA